METIRVDVQWCDKNFGASLSENVPGAVVLTAKTYEELLREVPETLRFHVDPLVPVGNYDFTKNDPALAEVANFREEKILQRYYEPKHYWFPLLDSEVYLYEDFKQNTGW